MGSISIVSYALSQSFATHWIDCSESQGTVKYLSAFGTLKVETAPIRTSKSSVDPPHIDLHNKLRLDRSSSHA